MTTNNSTSSQCGQDLPCMMAMVAQQGNESMMQVTDASLCPFQQADTDACYHVRCAARAARRHCVHRSTNEWAP